MKAGDIGSTCVTVICITDDYDEDNYHPYCL